MNLPGKLAHREQTDTHEFEVYMTDSGYFQGQYRALPGSGHVPIIWNYGRGGRTLDAAAGEMRSRIAWEHVAASDRG